MPQPLRIECARYHVLSRGIVGGIVPDNYDRERFVATLGEAATPMPVKTRAASQERERRAGVVGR
jgi:hypothetical protein